MPLNVLCHQCRYVIACRCPNRGMSGSESNVGLGKYVTPEPAFRNSSVRWFRSRKFSQQRTTSYSDPLLTIPKKAGTHKYGWESGPFSPKSPGSGNLL